MNNPRELSKLIIAREGFNILGEYLIEQKGEERFDELVREIKNNFYERQKNEENI